MIRWCSYCQSFMGERPPFEDLTFTHGVCDACMSMLECLEDEGFEHIEELRRFHEALRDAGRRGDLGRAVELLRSAAASGLKAPDLLVGSVGPILYEVGALWERKQITVADEHRFTAFYRAVTDAIADLGLLPAAPRPEETCDVLLVQPRVNKHILGLDLVAYWLREHGLRVALIRAGATPSLEEAIAAHDPRCIGISVALPSQMLEAEELIARAAGATAGKALVVLGGQAVRSGRVSTPKPALALTDPRELFEAVAGLSAPVGAGG